MANTIDFVDIVENLTNVKSCIQFLRGRNLLLSDFFFCNVTCSKVGDISLTDKEIFQCNVCRHRHSIRTNSFWSKSKLPLTTLLAFFFSVKI